MTELSVGAWSVLTVMSVWGPESWRLTDTGLRFCLLIRTTRVWPSAPSVAHTLTAPAGAVTGSSWAPGGKAWANIISP